MNGGHSGPCGVRRNRTRLIGWLPLIGLELGIESTRNSRRPIPNFVLDTPAFHRADRSRTLCLGRPCGGRVTTATTALRSTPAFHVAQDLARGVAPGQAGDAAARVRAGTA